MAFRSVFLLWKHELFHESVRLLLKHPEVKVVGTTSDYTTASVEIHSLRPDTVLVEEPENEETDFVYSELQDISWDLRVISLNMNNNLLRSIELKQGVVEQADDLLRLILQE